MSHAATLRQKIEDALKDRIPGALTPRPSGMRETVPTGINALDELLRGGLPVGALAELVGPECSGRTTVALSFLARVLAEGNVCAWIDVSDVLDPETAAANGVDLERLLWVRCANGKSASSKPQSTKVSPQIIAPTQQETMAERLRPTTPGGGGSPHPRSEGRGMSQAIQQLLQQQPRSAAVKDRRRNREVGTPGVANRRVSNLASSDHNGTREEQVPTDRLPPRRGENLQAAPSQKLAARQRSTSLSALIAEKKVLSSQTPSHDVKRSANTHWSALDRALRTADLILQGGGFRAIVLDLGSTPAEMAWRVPMATWFRFRAACERSRVSFLLLTQHPCARSSADLVLRMHPGSFQYMGAVMTGMTYRGEMYRQRQHRPENNVISIRKEAQPHTYADWSVRAQWMRA